MRHVSQWDMWVNETCESMRHVSQSQCQVKTSHSSIITLSFSEDFFLQMSWLSRFYPSLRVYREKYAFQKCKDVNIALLTTYLTIMRENNRFFIGSLWIIRAIVSKQKIDSSSTSECDRSHKWGCAIENQDFQWHDPTCGTVTSMWKVHREDWSRMIAVTKIWIDLNNLNSFLSRSSWDSIFS